MARIDSPLFDGINEEEIEDLLGCAKAREIVLKKNEILFNEGQKPAKLYILLDGIVCLCKDNYLGDKSILTVIDREGDIFGEVYMFVDNLTYEYYAQALQDTRVLEIPKDFFYKTCTKACNFHFKLINNMLSILATKAYYLTKKNQLLASSSLRQKICKFILMNSDRGGILNLKITREELASYLNVTRPSLSRELNQMQKDKLISIERRKITIEDFNRLKEYL